LHLFEAIVAVNRPYPSGFKGDLCFSAAPLTHHFCPAAVKLLPLFAGPASGASFRDVLKTFTSVILLFSLAEKETPTTILANKDKVLVIHLPSLAPRALLLKDKGAILQKG